MASSMLVLSTSTAILSSEPDTTSRSQVRDLIHAPAGAEATIIVVLQLDHSRAAGHKRHA
jgi:hypothetical protein